MAHVNTIFGQLLHWLIDMIFDALRKKVISLYESIEALVAGSSSS